ncbi:MAG: ADP-ribosylglycohydrolase family protein [bacterium]|nr:ADP-ribosylglycohydrolase family protein [bacterium]MCP5065145.1 ADP-ribosylglycohydrolase family protein [bacterium]
MTELRSRIRAAWQGRISGCQLGKPIEVLSITKGIDALRSYLREADAFPLRDYVPALPGTLAEQRFAGSCRDQMVRSEPDDDINYTILALMMLEEYGPGLRTEDVGRSWLRWLPAGCTFTAERMAYRVMLSRAHEWFPTGAPPGFDLAECADHEFADWIGAQIRADLYGWVCPGRPARAAELARVDASLSHRGEGIHGAAFVAALGAAIPAADSLEAAVDRALAEIPAESDCAEAVDRARRLTGQPDGDAVLREQYADLPPVHTVNNLALVVWALLSHPDDFGAAIGDVVAAGLDTDCNGASVGGLWGLQGKPVPEAWTKPWQGRVLTQLSGVGEIELDDLVDRTRAVIERIDAAGD